MSTEDPGESETHNTPLNEKISGIPKEKIKSISIVNEIVDDTLLYNTILTANPEVQKGLVANFLKFFTSCVICQEPMYSPFVTGCGHTFCYDCILGWLERNKKCPVCRAKISSKPVLNVKIMEMTNMLVETALKQSDEKKGKDILNEKEEAIKTYRQHEIRGELFQNIFSDGTTYVDPDDNIRRCSHCHWEVNGTMCINCGLEFDRDSNSERDNDDEEDDDDSERDESMDDTELLNQFARIGGGIVFEDGFSGYDESDSDGVGSFIDDESIRETGRDSDESSNNSIINTMGDVAIDISEVGESWLDQHDDDDDEYNNQSSDGGMHIIQMGPDVSFEEIDSDRSSTQEVDDESDAPVYDISHEEHEHYHEPDDDDDILVTRSRYNRRIIHVKNDDSSNDSEEEQPTNSAGNSSDENIDGTSGPSSYGVIDNANAVERVGSPSESANNRRAKRRMHRGRISNFFRTRS